MRSRWKRRPLLVVGLAVLVGSASFVALLLYAPLPQEQSGTMALGGGVYSFETEHLFGGEGTPTAFSFDGVRFSFHLWCEVTPGGGQLCGNATESGGAQYAFTFWDGLSSGDPPWQSWVSPDGHEAVQYQTGGTARLLVAL